MSEGSARWIGDPVGDPAKTVFEFQGDRERPPPPGPIKSRS
jgi:hypothetical protein